MVFSQRIYQSADYMGFYTKTCLLLDFLGSDNALIVGWFIIQIVPKDGHIRCKIWTVQIVYDCLNAVLFNLRAVQERNGRR